MNGEYRLTRKLNAYQEDLLKLLLNSDEFTSLIDALDDNVTTRRFRSADGNTTVVMRKTICSIHFEIDIAE
jgi:hypothetical protein